MIWPDAFKMFNINDFVEDGLATEEECYDWLDRQNKARPMEEALDKWYEEMAERAVRMYCG